MEKVRMAVIGCGSFGSPHLLGLSQIPTAEITAICDVDEERLKLMAETYHVAEENCYTDYKDVLAREDVDAVSLPLPDQIHREIAVAAMRAGKHVFCEKPMALSNEDCKAMREVEKETGVKFMIGQVCRYTPSFKKVKELMEAGAIGDLVMIESEYAHDYGPGASKGWRMTEDRHIVIGGGCHAIDLIRWLAGDPEEVFGYANHVFQPTWATDDTVMAVLKMPNGVIGKVMVSSGVRRSYSMRTVVYGTKGTFVVDNKSNTFSYFEREVYGEKDRFPGNAWENVEQKIAIKVDDHNVKAELAEFCDCLINDKPILTNSKEGANTVALCTAIVESTKTGKPVKPDYVE